MSPPLCTCLQPTERSDRSSKRCRVPLRVCAPPRERVARQRSDGATTERGRLGCEGKGVRVRWHLLHQRAAGAFLEARQLQRGRLSCRLPLLVRRGCDARHTTARARRATRRDERCDECPRTHHSGAAHRDVVRTWRALPSVCHCCMLKPGGSAVVRCNPHSTWTNTARLNPTLPPSPPTRGALALPAHNETLPSGLPPAPPRCNSSMYSSVADQRATFSLPRAEGSRAR
jgi:hypothetical protein